MSEHAWFEEHLAGYGAGGLTPQERERIEHHAAGCEDCSGALADWAGFERSLDGLFAEVRPPAGWEGRLLQGLRTAPQQRLRWSTIVRVAAGIAAVVILGVLGALLHGVLEKGSLPFPGLWAEGPREKTQASNNMKAVAMDVHGQLLPSKRANDVFKKLPPGVGTFGTTNHGINFSPDGRNLASSFVDNDGNLDLWGRTDPNEFSPAKRRTPNVITEEQGREKKLSLTNNTETAIKRVQGLDDTLSMMDGSQRIQFASVFVDPVTWAVPENQPTPLPVLAGADINLRKDVVTGFGMGVEKKTMLGISPREEPKKVGGGGEPAYFKPSDGPPAKVVVKNEIMKPKGTVTSGTKVTKSEEFALGEKGKKEPPASADRKIVRTGDIEYQVDSFDKSVKRINRLIDLVKGAFVEDTKEDKQANGKAKGFVVVRLPPESLDKFLEDLRKDLGKTAELKSLRIGSKDVSKQFTDIESRLRAAKITEERILQIIKTGKGDIKDLVVAEDKLGSVRTKIEEMEGEIRYYNKQVSLSTLTIRLVERDIQAASALEVTEKIKMRVEVEEVEKAQEAVHEAVSKATGRLIKSDLKLHGAGQLEAILIFEVKPARVPEIRKVLKTLGNITKDEAERLQTAVGGTEPAGNIKPQVKDTHFEVRLYNLANIQPRETLTLTVATLDVPGSYKKLQEAVKGKGQVRKGQFNEKDKLNISATFDFDLHVKDRAAIDKVLADVGKEISRSTDQAQPSDNVTDQKIGYRLTLRSVASIPPREKITLAIEVKDVKKTTNDMVDAVKSLKEGLVASGPLFRLDANGQVRAVILFDVPFAAKDDLVKQFESAGTVRVQQTAPNPTVPENELATAHIDVALTSTGPIVPGDDALGPQLRKSLYYSFRIFSISLSFVLLGILGILPPALVLFAVYKLVRKWRKKTAAT